MSPIANTSDDSNHLIELTDTQMAMIGGGTKRRGSDTVVITQPIIVGYGGYGGFPIVPINTVISGDDGRK